jgi:hypothetical protein
MKSKTFEAIKEAYSTTGGTWCATAEISAVTDEI